MPVEIIDRGQNNVFDISLAPNLKGRITFRGDNNRFWIGAPMSAGSIDIDLGTDSSVSIGERAIFGTLLIYTAKGCNVDLGSSLGVTGKLEIYLHEPSNVSVGVGCLLGSSVSFITSDMHPIFDLASGQRINPALDIILGRRVWVGSGALLTKGCNIGSYSVIGARSVVTGNIPEFVVAAGSPARIVKENVTWCRELTNELPARIREEITSLQRDQLFEAQLKPAKDQFE